MVSSDARKERSEGFEAYAKAQSSADPIESPEGQETQEKTPENPPQTPPQTEEDPLEKLKKENEEIRHKMSSFTGRLSASDREKNRLAQELEKLRQENQELAKKANPPKPVVTPEEEQEAEAYFSNYGGKKEVEVVAKRIAHDMVSQTKAELEQKLAQEREAARLLLEEQNRRHVADVLEAHPDAGQYSSAYTEDPENSELGRWVASLEPQEQERVKYIMREGTAFHVIKLLDRFKARDKKETPSSPRVNQTLATPAKGPATVPKDSPAIGNPREESKKGFNEYAKYQERKLRGG